MIKRVLLLGTTVALSMGVSCTVIPGGGGGGGEPNQPGGGGTTVTLDTASANIRIDQAVGATQADVTATLTDSSGRTLHLTSDQYVRVNDVDLVGPDPNGQYTATVAAASEYRVAAREPTRGVTETSIDAPADFAITAPPAGGAASLSGFTVTWSLPNTQTQVEIVLSQTIFGSVQTETFGPFPDTGSRTLASTDLQDFRQGADLTIRVNKLNTLGQIAGFRTGTLSAGVDVSESVTPAP